MRCRTRSGVTLDRLEKPELLPATYCTVIVALQAELPTYTPTKPIGIIVDDFVSESSHTLHQLEADSHTVPLC